MKHLTPMLTILVTFVVSTVAIALLNQCGPSESGSGITELPACTEANKGEQITVEGKLLECTCQDPDQWELHRPASCGGEEPTPPPLQCKWQEVSESP